MSVSPDGALAVLGTRLLPLLLVYDLPTGRLLHGLHLPPMPGASGAERLAFLPDSSCVIAACGGVLHVLDVRAGTLVRPPLTLTALLLSFTPAGVTK